MPGEGATENVDPNRSKETSAAEVIESENAKIKGVSWQDGVDGKSLFTVSSRASRRILLCTRTSSCCHTMIVVLSLHMLVPHHSPYGKPFPFL